MSDIELDRGDEERAERLLDDMNDRFLSDKLRDARERRDFAMVAANIATDRYSAGSTAARCTIVIMLLHGTEAAENFMADLEHHES